ncbi:MAG: DUF1273 family protein [Clostridia bacterium]|nr:DUF1273 family protein [Clostridia bacterium]
MKDLPPLFPPADHEYEEAADELCQPLSFVTREMISDVFDSQLRGRQDITACFTGHRQLPPEDAEALSDRLDELLECLARHGYRDFISGAALGFDLLAAERVIALKRSVPDVRLLLAIPCQNQTARWRPADTDRYEHIVYHADSIAVLSPRYYEGCMQVRNRFMVDRSSLCICYMTAFQGGTASTVHYAQTQKLPVVNVADEEFTRIFIRNMDQA